MVGKPIAPPNRTENLPQFIPPAPSSERPAMVVTTTVHPKTNEKILQFPDFSPRQDMHNWLYLYRRSFPAALAEYLGVSGDTIAGSEIPLSPILRNWSDYRIPDLMVSYNSDPDLLIAQRGYDIGSQGKPPDFVLEVASPATGINDYTRKREDYERYGVVEYWRFDPSGGAYHDKEIAGDRLANGRYVPIEIERLDDERLRGYSEELGLYLCWEYGDLLWYDPARSEYLQTYEEVKAQAEQAARRANEETAARRTETARAERAEAELRELRARLE